MGFRYTPADMIRRSDFVCVYQEASEKQKRRIRRIVQRLILENPSYRLPVYLGPGYLMMHWLMADLYTALAIFTVKRKDGIDQDVILAEIDACLLRSGTRLNRLMRIVMAVPGMFMLYRLVMPRTMTLANGHGFFVTPVKTGKNGFGFDVTACPYSSLFKKYHAQELGPVFCRFDDVMGSGIKGIRFLREGTLCRGNEKCDFRYLKLI